MRNEDITFVIQGPIISDVHVAPGVITTHDCIQSVRSYSPGSRIVLSTWTGESTQGLTADSIIFNSDPGAFKNFDGRPNNLNRHLLSTLNGLKAVDTEFTVKLRTDMKLIGSNYLNFFNPTETRNPNLRVFKNRLVSSTIFSRDPRVLRRFLYHPSDIFFFGRTDDLVNLFSAPLVSIEESNRWFESYKPGQELDEPDFYSRYTPEQYLWLNCLIRNGHDVENVYGKRIQQKHIHMSELSLINNFNFVSPVDLGLDMPRTFVLRETLSTYRSIDRDLLYSRYCLLEPRWNRELLVAPSRLIRKALLKILVPLFDNSALFRNFVFQVRNLVVKRVVKMLL